MNALSEFQAGAVAAAINKLINGQTFFISEFDAIAKLMGSYISNENQDYMALRALHCISWADLPGPMRERAREKIYELLGIPLNVVENTAKQTEPETGRKVKLAFWK